MRITRYLLELATLYEEHRELPQALDIYREFPDDPGAQERAGVLLLQTGQSAAAIATLEPVVAKSPTPANQIALAQAYVKEKQLGESGAADRQRRGGRTGGFRAAHVLRTHPQGRAEDSPRPRNSFPPPPRSSPMPPEAWTELAGVLIVAEQPMDGLAALDKVRALGAETSGPFLLCGRSPWTACSDRKKLWKPTINSSRPVQDANPDQEFVARQRVKVLEKELGKR